MKIKVCGMRDSANVDAISTLNPDYLGFIFYSPSPRFVGNTFEAAIVAEVKKGIETVGVFVNASVEEISRLHTRYAFDVVQLHGNETVDDCKRLRDAGFQVIKALGIQETFPSGAATIYQSAVDYLLFDTKTVKHGGSGRKFNWQVLNQYDGDTPFFLSGGIGPAHTEDILGLLHPKLHAIDLNSQFETVPGHKDYDLLLDFIETIRDEVPSRR